MKWKDIIHQLRIVDINNKKWIFGIYDDDDYKKLKTLKKIEQSEELTVKYKLYKIENTLLGLVKKKLVGLVLKY